MEKRYKADQLAFEKALRRISNKALRTLQRSLNPRTRYLSVQRERAKVIVESRLYFPQSAMLYLERCIKFRQITSWHCKLHLPYSQEAASKNPRKEKANQRSQRKTTTHKHHTKQLQKIKETLRKCKNLSSSGFISVSDDAFCQQNFPDHGLEEVYTEQRAYLMARKLQLQVKAPQKTAKELRSRKNRLWSTSTWMKFHSACRYACLTETDA